MPDPDALLVALILAPGTYSRNKFFELFQQEALWRARRRAQVVRSVIKDLTEPWPHPGEFTPRPQPLVTEEAWRGDEFHMSYKVEELGYQRSLVLSKLETAALRYALDRAGKAPASSDDKQLVEKHLARLTPLS